MTSKNYFFYLRWVLRLGAMFMVIESLFHASGARIAGISTIWPESAVTFVQLFVLLWASMCLVLAVVLYYLQKYLEDAKPLLVLLTIPAVIHAGLLFYLSRVPYTEILPLSNLYAWVSFYNMWILGEACSLLLYAAYIAYGRWKKFL